ncbi:MAG: helix-turn-helix transcriptional regulator [Caldilineaceae bacterium]
MMGRYQMETGKRLTFGQLAEITGVSRSSVTTAAAGQNKRVDLVTLDKLLNFFSEQLEHSVTVSDLLEFIPDRLDA